MLKKITESVFSFDIEWIPDPKSAEILLNSPASSGPSDAAKDSLMHCGQKPENLTIRKIFNLTSKPFYVASFQFVGFSGIAQGEENRCLN